MTKKEMLAKEFAADDCRDEMIKNLIKAYEILAKISVALEKQSEIRHEIVTQMIKDTEVKSE